MTSPFDRPELNDAEKTAQRELRDLLVRAAILAVDIAYLDHQQQLVVATKAQQTRFIVEAAIGALIADGLIAATIGDDEPLLSSMRLPEHLLPTALEARP